MGKRGYILTSFYAWDASNRSEDVQSYGPDILDLRARDLTSQEVNDLFLQAQSGDSAGLESEQDDDSRLDEANPAIVRFLARAERSEIEARLARRLEERLFSDLVLAHNGLSPAARDYSIKALQGRLDGETEELSRQRAELRREADRLAPHNTTEIIGQPPARGRS